MSLQKVGNRSLASCGITPHEHTDEVGIPGSHRTPLFYQDGRQLPVVARAQGIYIWDNDGKRYLDGCSGAMSANIGHGHPRVVARAHAQMQQVAFAYRTQFESEPARELASLLVHLSPPELNRVFFVNSGSEAVETAIKLARQYWWAKGRQGKQLVISRQPSYHGSTLGALSCTAYAPLNIPYQAMLLPFPKISAPYCYHCPLTKEYPGCELACAHELEWSIRTHGAENIAAFIAEPIGGASTGAAVPPDEYFPIIERICHEHEILLIVDDVLTGCGRTGTFFGFEHWDVTPDLVAVSKGLSGGYTPIGACLASDEIVQPVLETGGFMHGHTYAGNPLSTAVASEVIRVVLDEGLMENAREVGTYLHEKLWELKAEFTVMGDVRGRGLLAGVEFIRDRQQRESFPAHWFVAHEATEIAREKGLLIYPRRSVFGLYGDHVLLAPPLTIDRAGVDELIGLFRATLVELSQLLERYLEDVDENWQDTTIERYQQPEDLADYAIGNVDDIEPQPDVNVTSSMEGSELELRPPEEPGEKR